MGHPCGTGSLSLIPHAAIPCQARQEQPGFPSHPNTYPPSWLEASQRSLVPRGAVVDSGKKAQQAEWDLIGGGAPSQQEACSTTPSPAFFTPPWRLKTSCHSLGPRGTAQILAGGAARRFWPGSLTAASQPHDPYPTLQS